MGNHDICNFKLRFPTHHVISTINNRMSDELVSYSKESYGVIDSQAYDDKQKTEDIG